MTSTTLLSTPLHILFLGATGYIGGSVLDRLLTHPARSSYDIVSYSRDPERAQKLEAQFGVRSVLGSLDDGDKIEAAAAKADVVIHTANSADHLGSAEAILRGLKKRHAETGKVPIYIHTSGTGVLTDDAKGEHDEHITYDDTDVEQIKSIPDEAIHRNVDLTLLAADKEGYVRTYIVLPSTIYGLATGPLFSAQLANPHSIQIPALIKAGLTRGRAGVVGKGLNVWPLVHVNDIADLYLVLFNALCTDPEVPGHGWEGFYFGENGSYKYLDAGEAIGKAFVKAGKNKAGEETPTAFTKEEIDKFFGGSEYLGSNCRCVSARARALGWKPHRATDDFFASIQPEVEAIIASGKLGMGEKL